MAPEQCEGSAELDATADVYSMAATLFHLLCGRPPFVAEATMRLIDEHRYALPPRADKINPAVTEATANVIQRGLAKSPADRHADAGEFLEDLRALIAGRPIQASNHPKLPPSQSDGLMTFELHCDLRCSPKTLGRSFQTPIG